MQGKVTWHIVVFLGDTASTYKILFIVELRKNIAMSGRVLLKGISLAVFLD